jgi:hypothetical protein
MKSLFRPVGSKGAVKVNELIIIQVTSRSTDPVKLARQIISHGVGYMMRRSSLEVGTKLFLGKGEGKETRVQTALQIEIAHASMAGHEGHA